MTGATTRRRRYKRFSGVIELSLKSQHMFYTGFTENISTGGLFIARESAPPDLGSRMLVSFTLPHASEPISAGCEVRWVRPAAGPGAPAGFGVRFVDLPEDAGEAIDAFIAQRGSLFYVDEE